MTQQTKPTPFAELWRKLEESRRAATWIAFGVTAICTVFREQFPHLAEPALLIYLALLTSTLFTVLQRVDERRTRFRSLQEAAPAIIADLERSLGQRQPEIQWMGITLVSAWATLEPVLSDALVSGRAHRVTVKLLQAHPEFLNSILDDGAAARAQALQESIAAYARNHQRDLLDSGSTVDLAQYGYMPHLHGVLINRRILYISSAKWEGTEQRELGVPNQPFERWDLRSEQGEETIAQFLSWCDYAAADHRKRLSMADDVEPDAGPHEAPKKVTVRRRARDWRPLDEAWPQAST